MLASVHSALALTNVQHCEQYVELLWKHSLHSLSLNYPSERRSSLVVDCSEAKLGGCNLDGTLLTHLTTWQTNTTNMSVKGKERASQEEGEEDIEIEEGEAQPERDDGASSNGDNASASGSASVQQEEEDEAPLRGECR